MFIHYVHLSNSHTHICTRVNVYFNLKASSLVFAACLFQRLKDTYFSYVSTRQNTSLFLEQYSLAFTALHNKYFKDTSTLPLNCTKMLWMVYQISTSSFFTMFSWHSIYHLHKVYLSKSHSTFLTKDVLKCMLFCLAKTYFNGFDSVISVKNSVVV